MKIKLIATLFLAVTALCTFESRAEAGLVLPSSPASSVLYSESALYAEYNPQTELFGAISPSGGSGAGFAFSQLRSGSFTAFDFAFGQFTLAANIDNAGNVLNGSFSVTGTSTYLGATVPTTLLSGNIVAVGANQVDGLDFLSTDLFIAPALETFTGPISEAVLRIFAWPNLEGKTMGTLDFTHGASEVNADTSPDILFYSIPEPSSALPFVTGLLALIFLGAGRIGSIFRW